MANPDPISSVKGQAAPAFTTFTPINTRLVNDGTAESIVSLASYKNKYINFPNIILPSERDTYIENYSLAINDYNPILEVDYTTLSNFFAVSDKIIIIVENIDGGNLKNASIHAYPYPPTLIGKPSIIEPLLGTLGTTSTIAQRNRCFILEKKYFDKKNDLMPDGFKAASLAITSCIITLGNETNELTADGYIIIINGIVGSLNNQQYSFNNYSQGGGNIPPSIGTKIPPKS